MSIKKIIKHKKGTTNQAKQIAENWISENFADENEKIGIGLPEYDDRYDQWRIPLYIKGNGSDVLGEIRLNNVAKKILSFTELALIKKRLKNSTVENKEQIVNKKKFYPAPIPNKVILGNCIDVLEEYPPDTAQLIFTSPPYYNAKPEYSEYLDYQEYLDFMRKVFVRCHNILSEGRFIVVNISPVLIRRTSRKSASRRIPIPFDFHKILENSGFEFIDDIIWVKPEGAGWNVGRGRRFRADRKPLQYKPVPVTENLLVYRKKTEKLIDWNLRNHYNLDLVEESKIIGEYDVTNVWHLPPGHSRIHPAVFPTELAEKVIKYYSFKDDMVLDPFGGIGTTGFAALNLQRRFMIIENDATYYNYAKAEFEKKTEKRIRIDYDINEEYLKNFNGLQS